MATLNRSALTSTPTFSEEFATFPACWTEAPRGAGKFRLKYDHSGDSPLARGLGMNGETQIYSNLNYLGGKVGAPHSLVNGVWRITATPASDEAKAAVAASVSPTYAFPKVPRFVSGMLSTEGYFYQQYGYFEWCLKEMPCVGSFSAGWLMNPVGDRHQEIDAFERRGGDPNKILCTAHSELDQWGGVRSTKFAKSLPLITATAADLHRYGVLWTRETITWFLDDASTGSMANPGIHHPLMMITNLAMDGDWNKQRGFIAADGATAWLEIKHLKAWQLR